MMRGMMMGGIKHEGTFQQQTSPGCRVPGARERMPGSRMPQPPRDADAPAAAPVAASGFLPTGPCGVVAEDQPAPEPVSTRPLVRFLLPADEGWEGGDKQ